MSAASAGLPLAGTQLTRLAYGAAAALVVLGAVVSILPERIHDPVERPAGAFLVLIAVVWARALRNARASRADLAAQLEMHERIEEELARSEERFRLAQKIARIGTWDMPDLESRLSTWSDTLLEMYGVEAGFVASFEHFVGLVEPEDRTQVFEAVGPAFERGGEWEFEYRFRRPDGEIRWMLSRGRVLVDEHGEPTRALGVAMDITDRKAAEAERAGLEGRLRQAQKLEAVGRLAGGVAHDFNNLLLGIRGYGELALNAFERGEDAQEEVEEILTAADRAAALTRQLLAFSRKQVLRPETLDLNEVVSEMEKLLTRMIGEDVALDAVLADAEIYVDADRGQLEQVIANLAVNARDAMPGGGELSLEVSTVEVGRGHGGGLEPGRYALLAVSDTGCGMDDETVAQIFEPFFTTKEEGTGLGLATVHGIVRQSGGSIWVYSEVGAGTTFKIYLPLSDGVASRAECPQPVLASEDGAGETILLVEDDSQVRAIVAMMLEARGYRVLVSSDGEEALRLADPRNGSIDLLLSDLVMPGLGGREVARRLTELHPDTGVLYMSGYTDDAVIRRGVLDRTAAFIEKPFSSDELARRIRELLDDTAGRRAASTTTTAAPDAQTAA